MQVKPLKTPAQRQPEAVVLVLDAALMDSEDQKLVKALIKISQEKNAKIVVVGNISVQMQVKLQGINIEMISLEDLKANKKNYNKDKTYCFMSQLCSVINRTKIKQNFPGSTTLESGEKLSNCDQFQSFCSKLPENITVPKKSVAMENRQSALLESGHGIFASGSAPTPVKAGVQAIAGIQVVPQLPSPPVTVRRQPSIPGVVRQRPATPMTAPVGKERPDLYFTRKCLAIALGKADCADINLPEISLSTEGCLNIKLKKDLVKSLEQNQLLDESFEFDLEGNLVGKFNNVEELLNLLRPCGFHSPQDGGYSLSLALLEADDIVDITPEAIRKWVFENRLQTPVLIQYDIGVISSFMNSSERYSFYRYDLSKYGKPEITILENKDGQFSSLNSEKNSPRVIHVSPQENSLVYREIALKKQPFLVNIENLYKDLCANEGHNFMHIWNVVKQPVKYPEKCKASTLLCQKLSKNQYNDVNMIDLSLDVEGCLEIKVRPDLANFIFQNTYLTTLFKSEENGKVSAKFTNIAELNTVLKYCQIGSDDLNLKTLYQELCDKDGRDFSSIWESVNITSFFGNFFG